MSDGVSDPLNEREGSHDPFNKGGVLVTHWMTGLGWSVTSCMKLLSEKVFNHMKRAIH